MAVVSPLAKYKLAIIGDQYVGKTSIVTRFLYDKFDSTYQATIGIDSISKTMYVEDRTVRLQLWDTAGQESFRSLIPSYVRDATVVVIVYNVANRNSFLNISNWIKEVRTVHGDGNAIIIVLVGNKADLVDQRQVSIEEGDCKAREFGAMFVETSAKADFNVKHLFEKIALALPGFETTSVAIKEENMPREKERKRKSRNPNPSPSPSRNPSRRYRCDNCGGDGHTVDGCWDLLHPTVAETEHKPEHVFRLENRIETSAAAHGLDLSDLKHHIKILINKLNYILQVQESSVSSTNSETMKDNTTDVQNQDDNWQETNGEWVLCSVLELDDLHDKS